MFGSLGVNLHNSLKTKDQDHYNRLKARNIIAQKFGSLSKPLCKCGVLEL